MKTNFLSQVKSNSYYTGAKILPQFFFIRILHINKFFCIILKQINKGKYTINLELYYKVSDFVEK